METSIKEIDLLISFFSCENPQKLPGEDEELHNMEINGEDIDKIISYFTRHLNMIQISTAIIKIIYKYQRIIRKYQLPPLPISHSCVQAFKLNSNKNSILLQIACTFCYYDTKTFEYNFVAQLFPKIQRNYHYHSIYIPKQNKIFIFHGVAPNYKSLIELQIENKSSFQCKDTKIGFHISNENAFGMRSVIVNNTYFLTFYGDNTGICYNYITNQDVVFTMDLPNHHKVSSAGIVSLKNNMILIFSNNAMYKVKFKFAECDNFIIPVYEVEAVENALFKNDFILHEFGYVKCNEYIFIFGGNYNNYKNPVFSDDIYIYNINDNKFYKSKTKLPFKYNVKNNNLFFDNDTKMIHVIGANEYVDKIYCDPTDINQCSKCHLMFDYYLLINKGNMEQCINEKKKVIETSYSRCFTIYLD